MAHIAGRDAIPFPPQLHPHRSVLGSRQKICGSATQLYHYNGKSAINSKRAKSVPVRLARCHFHRRSLAPWGEGTPADPIFLLVFLEDTPPRVMMNAHTSLSQRVLGCYAHADMRAVFQP